MSAALVPSDAAGADAAGGSDEPGSGPGPGPGPDPERNLARRDAHQEYSENKANVKTAPLNCVSLVRRSDLLAGTAAPRLRWPEAAGRAGACIALFATPATGLPWTIRPREDSDDHEPQLDMDGSERVP